jgi:hypothetical protein
LQCDGVPRREVEVEVVIGWAVMDESGWGGDPLLASRMHQRLRAQKPGTVTA